MRCICCLGNINVSRSSLDNEKFLFAYLTKEYEFPNEKEKDDRKTKK